MIEMSLEKETVLAGDGVGGVLSPPQNLLGRTKTPSPPTQVPIGIGAPFMANMVLAELPPSEVEGGVSETLRVRGDGKPLQLKNGLQSQAGPQQQQQKLSKRRYSMNAGFKHPGFSKRRRRANSDCDPVLPTNFLLGGNIFDPLNLNSLLDEEVNKALNAETPKSSPLPAKSREPVEILIPKDITDPLNLSGRGGDAHGGVLVSPMKSGGRRRHRNRHHGGPNGGQLDPADSDRSKGDEGGRQLFPVQHAEAGQEGAVPEESREGVIPLDLEPVEESPRPYELNTSINCRDEVVPPILPRRRSNTSTNSAPQAQTGSSNSTSSTHPAKHRKRRRTISRSERLSITPTPTVKQSSVDRVRSQTFHTPVVAGAAGGHRTGSRQAAQNKRKPQRKFQYGTYSRYYGYQTPGLNRDPRLAVFRPEWFRGRKVLDVGCNVGHVTLAIAKHWSPAHILGLDIDGRLVHAARQNLRHFLSELQRQEVQRGNSAWGELSRPRRKDDEPEEEGTERLGETKEKREEAEARGGPPGGRARELVPLMKLKLELLRPFPVSFRLCRGPIAAPPLQPHTPGVFPNNVSFMKGNYVPESEAAVMSQRAEYDAILCLGVTKWVHLNWGDLGLQWFFKRAYRHLTPGGVLILEPQPWSSYSKRKRLTETTFRNYNCIRLRPDQFSTYLTSEVGFTSYELISTPNSCPKGLQRPIYLFHKGPASCRK
ncbi:7SK snRNA methylphosphate capping enzyme [Pygocentrus nattereri]|uniref:RNA methyltransferase n=1 Tax=Pygocentrus nattereri TaxID=42514 RepID=A0A3B4CA03_PYGNA|nr:7SK snRNA methylphosphate capping enzyme [Pygocentrus nattereri]XP_017541785.2 7SK snRNA methylphosphate capping enzyme [Pygocentrus nattereri]XP_017541786.2 7SK snRNA methylphosphate capping enzyme [Pygocentrus nattereri]XP_017541787.2 7SK snRNA methylphosphate capping enzyme [Pygocentrus nattereri]